MGKRTVIIYAVFIMLCSVIIYRIYYLTQSDFLTQAANNQSSYLLNVAHTRGNIYDENFAPLVNEETSRIAAVLPCPESTAALAQYVTGAKRSAILEQTRQTKPFLVTLDNVQHIYAKGIDTFTVPKRYSDQQLAPHIIGYLNGDHVGVAGLEKAYDTLLSEQGEEIQVRYTIDGSGTPLASEYPQVEGSSEPTKSGIVLTLDKDIQEIAENAAREKIDKGAIIVMNPKNGDIKAMVSFPEFDPTDVASVLKDADAPLYNRAIGRFCVGSTFKLVVAASALDNGISPYFTHNCTGSIMVGDQSFACHYLQGHGVFDMRAAVEQSCNPYFITLAQKLGSDKILASAKKIGFGEQYELAPGLKTESGTLPSESQLINPAAQANFSFGQGDLTATPIQVAQMVSTIANGGMAVAPRLVKGVTEDAATLSQQFEQYTTNRVFSEKSANQVRQYMVDVVEKGSGVKGKPEVGGAGGKTASAQTGQYIDGQEVIHAWFAGFIPADSPKYVIVVLVEGGKWGGDIASPIFKEIADKMNELMK